MLKEDYKPDVFIIIVQLLISMKIQIFLNSPKHEFSQKLKK